MKLSFEEAKKDMNKSNIIMELRQYEHIILFGAGKSGDYFFQILLAQGLSPTCFCDNYKEKWGKMKNDLAVISFERAVEQYPDAAICITSVFGQEIYHQICNHDIKLKEQIFFVMNTMNWETADFVTESHEAEWIAQHYEELMKTYHMMEDEYSQRTMEGILNFRITRNFAYIKTIVSPTKIYFDEKLFPPEERRRFANFIDGGSFTGDTLQTFLQFVGGKGYQSVYCFEPETAAAERLEENILSSNITGVEVIRAALWDEEGTVAFFESGAGGSSVHKNRGYEVEVKTKTLDGMGLKNIDFIKLDVEGAEYEALLGAKNLIKRDKPILAICVYHKQDDLIKIPQLIKSFNNNYRFYLRQYAEVPFETVLYAINYKQVLK